MTCTSAYPNNHLPPTLMLLSDKISWHSFAVEVQAPNENLGLLASLVVDGVHPSERNGCQHDACQVPVVPLHPVFVHQVGAAGEAALREDNRLDMDGRGSQTPGELKSTSHGHCCATRKRVLKASLQILITTP